MIERGRIVGGILLLSLAAGCRSPDDGSIVASGTVEATEAQLGFPAGGRLVDVAVREGQAVTAGTVLATLDRAEVEARREQAEAQLSAARAALRELESGFRVEEIAQAREARAAAASRLADAEQSFARTRTLRAGGAVSQESLDRAQVALDVARSQTAQADEQLRMMESGPRPERIQAQRAQVRQAEAAGRALDVILANLTLAASFDGVVTTRHREPGEIVPPGAPVVTVMAPSDRWVRIYVPENRLGGLRLGASAEIISDTYPDKRYPGAVTFIAGEAEFTPKTVQTTEERVKLVYQVKVRITGDPALELKPGMPADVRLALTAP
ncbi:MAG: HlyD family efflux transporter periplasmic adaptor subunit [Gemmatimonadales bacterium]